MSKNTIISVNNYILVSFQVRLPRNQLAVLRVSPKTTIAEVLKQVCYDKGLDIKKYDVRHPGKWKYVFYKQLSKLALNSFDSKSLYA